MDSSVIVKVMLVDDEPLALDDICSIFDWEAHGFTIVAKARNGEEAFEAYKKESPDVVITDVKMPVMDGIDLATKIRRLNMNTRIIFLTSFEDFGYAKEALRLNVKDYILKYEISEESIMNILSPVRDEIILELKNHTLKFSRYITEHFDNDIMVNRLDEQCDKKLQKLIENKYYYLLFEECMPLPIMKNFAAEKWPVPVEPEQVISISMDFESAGIKTACAAIVRAGRYVVLINGINTHSEAECAEILRKFAWSIASKLKNTLGRNFTPFIMPSQMSFKEASAFYKTNISKLYCRYLFGQNKVYNIADSKYEISVESLELDKDLIENLVKSRKCDELMSYFDSICGQAIAENNYPAFTLIVSSLIGFLNTLSSGTSGNFRTDSVNSSDIESFYDARSITDWIKYKYKEYISKSPEYESLEYTRYVQKALEYIQNNFRSPDFSIEQMALTVSLSVVRLEKLFKMETGKTIIDYMTMLRVQSAKELLINGCYKVYEVSDHVGYSSSQYFSKVFKKAVGMSPLDYKLWGSRK